MSNNDEQFKAEDEPGDSQGSDLDRRDYLQSVSAVSAVSVLGGLGLNVGVTGSAAAQQSWADAADQRIEEHRTGDLEVVVENPDGTPVEGASVSVEQQSHDFGFGTAVHAEFLTRGSEWGDDIHSEQDRQNYEEAIEEHFNVIVLENLHKWYLWEENVDIADEAVQWARDRGMDVRGHVCLWGNVGAWALPPRVVEAMGDPWASEWEEAGEPDYDPDYVVEESMNHIEEIISHYGGDVTEWEVVNEVIHETSIIEAVEGEGVDPVTAPILGDWYQEAERIADQYDVTIAVNDYNTLVGPYGDTRDDYERQVDYLVSERGVDLDGIGFQCHFGYDERLDSDQIMDGLDRFAGYGAGLRATEFDMFQGNWSEQEQAEFMHMFLKLFFSHSDAEDFLMWGIWDPIHWGDEMGEDQDAPLYDDNWNEKPAYDEYVGLVFDEWWTDETDITDGNGTYTTNAFLGEHEITVSTDSDSANTTEYVSDSDGTTTVTLTVSGEGTGNGDDPGNGDDDPGNGDDDTDDLIADIDPSTTAASTDETVQFWAEDTTDCSNWIDSLEWDLGNGTTATGWYTDVRYDSSGTYTVTLTATNNEGNSTTAEVTVTVS